MTARRLFTPSIGHGKPLDEYPVWYRKRAKILRKKGWATRAIDNDLRRLEKAREEERHKQKLAQATRPAARPRLVHSRALPDYASEDADPLDDAGWVLTHGLEEACQHGRRLALWRAAVLQLLADASGEACDANDHDRDYVQRSAAAVLRPSAALAALCAVAELDPEAVIAAFENKTFDMRLR